jgi:hypothetical protein
MNLDKIREAAERIPKLANVLESYCPAVVPVMLGVRDGIIKLVDEAEKDSMCQLEPPDNDIDFPHCSRCACMIQIIEMDSFGETVKVHDDYCPGCGRKIEGGGQG